MSATWPRGVMPASLTPYGPQGEVDAVGLARLGAGFEAAGSVGIVLGGTNGEGPSLSAVEKRDLVRGFAPARGQLKVVAGLATSSLTEAIWLAQQAAKSGADAVLVMAPGGYANLDAAGIRDWFFRLADASPLPLILYHHPLMSRVTWRGEHVAELVAHPQCMGLKDSSGDPANLAEFRAAWPEAPLWVGDERLLLPALQAGWHGTISGCANVMAAPLCQVVQAWETGETERAERLFARILPLIEALRRVPQPAHHKRSAFLQGRIERPDVRPPLTLPEESAFSAWYESLPGGEFLG